MNIEIKRIGGDLPIPALEGLLAASAAEGVHIIQTLIDRWNDGSNRFDQPGEALFFALEGGNVIGVGGRNIDPYVGDSRVLRVRRIYVSPAFRARGIARLLLKAILDVPTQDFTCFTLATQNPAAARLYESIGFSPTGEAQTTHQLWLQPEKKRTHA
jgi:GNAT superfamily N-acetyltransferase